MRGPGFNTYCVESLSSGSTGLVLTWGKITDWGIARQPNQNINKNGCICRVLISLLIWELENRLWKYLQMHIVLGMTKNCII